MSFVLSITLTKPKKATLIGLNAIFYSIRLLQKIGSREQGAGSSGLKLMIYRQ
jgi:hypothetical protein